MTKTFRNITLATLAGAMVVTSGFAMAESRGDGPRGMMRIMTQIDTNEDGNIASAELTAFITERFNEADTDNNASLTQEEIAEAMPHRRGGRGEARGERLLQRVDINADGGVTLAEVTERANEMFAVMDVDNSGVVEADELPKRGERRGNRGN